MEFDLTKDQKIFLVSLLRRDREKTEWVINNKALEDGKKSMLENNVLKMAELIQLFEN